jgi:Sulfite reductase, beta subunit (hemoprotein)
VRQWSTLHPEVQLPAAQVQDRRHRLAQRPRRRAVHDIGLRLWRNAEGEVGFEVIVGGGLGRTPMIGKTLREFLPKDELLAYLEATLRVYNATAGATISTRPASRSWCTRSAPRRCARRSRPNMPR